MLSNNAEKLLTILPSLWLLSAGVVLSSFYYSVFNTINFIPILSSEFVFSIIVATTGLLLILCYCLFLLSKMRTYWKNWMLSSLYSHFPASHFGASHSTKKTNYRIDFLSYSLVSLFIYSIISLFEPLLTFFGCIIPIAYYFILNPHNKWAEWAINPATIFLVFYAILILFGSAFNLLDFLLQNQVNLSGIQIAFYKIISVTTKVLLLLFIGAILLTFDRLISKKDTNNKIVLFLFFTILALYIPMAKPGSTDDLPKNNFLINSALVLTNSGGFIRAAIELENNEIVQRCLILADGTQAWVIKQDEELLKTERCSAFNKTTVQYKIDYISKYNKLEIISTK